MSKVTIAGDVNGTGVFTIAAPNGNTNRTLVLPDEAGTLATTAFVTNRLVQNLNVTTSAYATGTTRIPSDDTIPQITEGTQFLQLAITPTSTTSLLEISVILNVRSGSEVVVVSTALFKNADANALQSNRLYTATNFAISPMVLTHRIVAGSTAEQIFRVRAGPNTTGSVAINGDNNRIFGGVLLSSITIKEYAA